MMARCYLRVSTEDQAKEGYSLGAQRDRLGAFALSQGWTVAEYYIDEGISAKDMKRPALKKMLTEIQRGEVVLVYKLDRLTRSVADLDLLLRKWEADGALFRSCTEDFNTTTAAGRLFIRLVADLAQWERENLAERTRMGMVKRAQEGEWNGGPAPFGYTAVETGERNGQKVKRMLMPNEYAPVVRELYERYVSGQGMRTLTLWLNREKGIKSPRGGTFSDATVSGILKNAVYAGLNVWSRGVKKGLRNPEAVVAEGKHEPIVSRALWSQAQQMRERRLSLPPRHATGGNILTGIGRCGACGGFLKINLGGTKGRPRYYRCGNYVTKGTCRVSSIPADVVEANFVAAVCAWAAELTDTETARAYAATHLQEEQVGRERLTPQELRRQVSQAKQAIAVWDKALEEKRIDFSVWQAKISPHSIRLRDLEAQLRVVSESREIGVALDAMITSLKSFSDLWGAATTPERKMLAGSFFKEVRVYQDRRVELLPRGGARVQPRVQYLVPPGIADKDLPPEVRAGLRLCARIAARIAGRRPSLTQVERTHFQRGPGHEQRLQQPAEVGQAAGLVAAEGTQNGIQQVRGGGENRSDCDDAPGDGQPPSAHTLQGPKDHQRRGDGDQVGDRVGQGDGKTEVGRFNPEETQLRKQHGGNDHRGTDAPDGRHLATHQAVVT
ncbi:MAG TPA: recombinase family protein [Symbiobacteriaceae bacterium]|jgi:site-specific DNA recombinase